MPDFREELKRLMHDSKNSPRWIYFHEDTPQARLVKLVGENADRIAALVEAVDGILADEWGHDAITCEECLKALGKMKAARSALNGDTP